MKNTDIKQINLFKRNGGGVHYAVYYASGAKRDFFENDNIPNTVLVFMFEVATTTECKTTETGSITIFR